MTGRGRKHQVVDTNVLVAANQQATCSRRCAAACARALLDLRDHGAIVLDNRELILAEYKTYCSHSGQPGVGDSFFRWIYDNRGRAELITIASVTPREDARGFDEFPTDQGLSNFDPADRKFVAAANSHHTKPPILQATDSKWLQWEGPLNAVGINVEFLCKQEIQAVLQEKLKN